MEDPRKTGLKNGLRQLTSAQIERVLAYQDEMILDDCNYRDGKFCPLAIAVGMHEWLENPSNEKVVSILERMHFKVYNTRGIKGNFYTTDRQRDLIVAAREVLDERRIDEQHKVRVWVNVAALSQYAGQDLSDVAEVHEFDLKE